MKSPHAFRGVFRSDELARAVYSEAAGVARILPAAVAVPADAEDVVALVVWAAANDVALVPRGAGSSMAGGALGDGVIVDFARLDDAPTFDPSTRLVRVGPAVTRERLEEVASRTGLTFPVDPSSGSFATLGGMCATNAAGARSVKYGAMRAWVHGLDCVFADGARGWLRRSGRDSRGGPDHADSGADYGADIPAVRRFLRDVAPRVIAADAHVLRHVGVRKESSGYGLAAWSESGDAVDLIIGSEGTLACIVGVELRLAPLPAASASLLAGFADLEAAAAAAVQLAALGASAVEMLDRTFLEIAASEGNALPLPAHLEAVLLVEVEARSAPDVRHAAQTLAEHCQAAGAVHLELASDAASEAKLWQLRHAASPILNRLAPRLRNMQIVEDGCVPPDRFAEYVRGVREALAAARFRGVIFGHAGDGHAHVNALVDVTEADWRARVERLLVDVTALVARLGGTLTGEHGDGRLRSPLLPQVWPAEALALFAATKEAFDPDGVFNPGVKVPAAGARPLADMKYDASLPSLPSASRAALDLVVRERAWGRHRLDLLPASNASR